jgi:hypothetical protein
MRRSSWTPPIVPTGNDQTVYLVADDLGRVGQAWREADYETTDLETVIQDLLTGQYSNSIRVIFRRFLLSINHLGIIHGRPKSAMNGSGFH